MGPETIQSTHTGSAVPKPIKKINQKTTREFLSEKVTFFLKKATTTWIEYIQHHSLPRSLFFHKFKQHFHQVLITI
jgi:hypothetical protein